MLLDVRGLRTSFETRSGIVRAVDGVSFHLDQGETLGLVGESGCGKSVTALSLMRLVPEPPGRVSGSIIFDGKDVLRLSARGIRHLRGRDVAMVFQDPMTSLNPVMTVGRQVMESLQLHLGLRRGAARSRAIELLELVGIPSPETRIDDYPHQFSGGMRQRAMIAMAISCRPKLLLADEITTALDVTIQEQILRLIKDLAAEFGTATILITHNLGIVAGMTQRVHVMYGGQIVEKATTTELFANPKMPYTWGLLRSLPRLDGRRAKRLVPIEGIPPDLIDPPSGCRFEPRCPYRRQICREKAPELNPVPHASPGHDVRCWGTQNTPGGGWLIDTDWRYDIGDSETLQRLRPTADLLGPGVETAQTRAERA